MLKNKKLFKFHQIICTVLIAIGAVVVTATTPIFAAPPTAQEAIGTLNPTPGAEQYGSANNGGVTSFINTILGILAIAAGIGLLFNIIMAAISLTSNSGKADQVSQATRRILISILGLVLIALAWFIVGFVSRILFGNADFVTSPNISGP